MIYYVLAPFNIQVKTLAPGVVKTGFISRMNRVKEIPEEYKDIIDKQLKVIILDYNEIESEIEAANDAYNAVTDGDNLNLKINIILIIKMMLMKLKLIQKKK